MGGFGGATKSVDGAYQHGCVSQRLSLSGGPSSSSSRHTTDRLAAAGRHWHRANRLQEDTDFIRSLSNTHTHTSLNLLLLLLPPPPACRQNAPSVWDGWWCNQQATRRWQIELPSTVLALVHVVEQIRTDSASKQGPHGLKQEGRVAREAGVPVAPTLATQ